MFSRINAVDSRMYGFVRSIVRRRLVCWNDWGIDARTTEEEKHSSRRMNIEGEEEERREYIAFALQQPSFVSTRDVPKRAFPSSVEIEM
jgi:hypothetical protein